MKVVHSWLKDYVGESLASPEEVEKLLTFHAFEIEGVEKVAGEDVIELKILPDRAADCLSHRGVAREIANITGVPLVHDPLLSTHRLPLFSDITVAIEDTQACSRFGAVLITGIEVTESPQWLKVRLEALGQRSINNIVDATNYVMYALGQPLHAYDADKFPQVDGKWQFQVRFAESNETVSLIAEGGKQEDRIVTLTGSELLIVDGSCNRPIGLAGVKGGAYAGVDAATTKIIVEAAHFDPILTRKTARRLGIVIDASKRFENNPSSELIPHALREIVSLIEKIAGGKCEGSIDELKREETAKVVTVAATQVNSLLGLLLTTDQMEVILSRVAHTVSCADGLFTLTGTLERRDLNIPEDYIREIGRIHGYEHIVSAVPVRVPLQEINARHYYSEKVREVLTGLGFSEVITSSFNKKDQVELRNALASDKSFMRSTLRENIAGVLNKNAHLADFLGVTDIRVFEIGTVFTLSEGTVVEHISLCVGVRSKAQGYTLKDDTTVTEVIEVLTNELGIKMNFTLEKGVAECNFNEVFTQLPVPHEYKEIAVAEEIIYRPFSAYPAMVRDIALWVTEDVAPEVVEEILNETAGALRMRTTLVDVFTKEGRTSYAFRLVFQSFEKTLTDEEVNVLMDSVYTAVQTKGWETR